MPLYPGHRAGSGVVGDRRVVVAAHDAPIARSGHEDLRAVWTDRQRNRMRARQEVTRDGGRPFPHRKLGTRFAPLPHWGDGATIETMEDVLIELDSRLRVSLGKLGLAPHSRYLVTKEPDGRLIFTPAAVVSEIEARFLANRELVERTTANRADPSRMVRRKRG